MRPIAVVPASAAERVQPLLTAAGWEAAPPPEDHDHDAGPAVDVVRRGGPTIHVPADSAPATQLRRILLVHLGSRGDRAAVDAADEAAVTSGAEIIVLHLPSSTPTSTSASLPFRMADHAAYEWAEWREEFLRRFCRCSPGVLVTLRVGSTARLASHIREAGPDLVIVSAPTDSEPAVGEALEAMVVAATPVLIVPARGHERVPREEAEL